MAEKMSDQERAELDALRKINDALKGPSFIMRWHWRGDIGRLARRGLVKWGEPPKGFTKSKFAGVEITDLGRRALDEATHDR